MMYLLAHSFWLSYYWVKQKIDRKNYQIAISQEYEFFFNELTGKKK